MKDLVSLKSKTNSDLFKRQFLWTLLVEVNAGTTSVEEIADRLIPTAQSENENEWTTPKKQFSPKQLNSIDRLLKHLKAEHSYLCKCYDAALIIETLKEHCNLSEKDIKILQKFSLSKEK